MLARRSRGGDKTPRVGPGSCFALGTLDFEQGGGEQRNAQGTSPGPISLLGGCKDRWTKRGVNWAFFKFLKQNKIILTYAILVRLNSPTG